MPTVTDKSVFGVTPVTLLSSTGTPFIAAITSGRERVQKGYRSGSLTKAEQAGLNGRRDQTWKDTLRVAQGLEYEFNTRPGRQASRVNPRDYVESTASHSVATWSTKTERSGLPGVYYDDHGETALELISYTPGVGSLFPSEATASAIGAKLMRNSVPTAPAVDLVKSLVELRDLPRALRTGNYIPKTGKDYAGAYLNQVFGLQPTGKDIANIANAVMESTPIVRRFLEHEKHALRRSRTEVTGSLSFNFSWTPSTTGPGSEAKVIRDPSGYAWGRATNYCSPVGRLPSGARAGAFTIWVDVHANSTVKSFATFEYFIPRPTGFPDRLSNYRRKAEQVLGSGLSPAALYELTPWSWMLDWFVDMGGLLAYQQTVADNSVVATRSGWVQETYSTMSAYAIPSMANIGQRRITPLGSTSFSRESTRRAGGPYSILQPWSLSANQAAIVGALAVSRYSPF